MLAPPRLTRSRTVVAVAALTVVLASGCSASGSGSEAFGQPVPSSSDSSGVASGTGLRDQAPPDVPERKEVVTGSVSMRADDPVDAGHRITDLVEELDGRVDSSTESTLPSATLTVRVPADELDGFVDGLRDLGEIDEVRTDREDVTAQYTDLDARIGALRASVARLRALIDQADDTAALIEAENALTDRQAELDSLVAQQKVLDDRIALSTMTIGVYERTTVVDDGSFLSGLREGWDALVAVAWGGTVVLGFLLPWLILLAIVAVVLAVLLRWLIRRSAHRPVEPGHGVAGPRTSASGAEGVARAADAAAPAPRPGTSEGGDGTDVPAATTAGEAAVTGAPVGAGEAVEPGESPGVPPSGTGPREGADGGATDAEDPRSG